MMKTKKCLWIFKITKSVVNLFYGKIEFIGKENLPDEPCIIVGNHSQTNGPIVSEIYFSKECDTWCAAEMMKTKEVPAYAFNDFWSQKPKWTYPFFKLVSYLIAIPAAYLFSRASAIPVYHDNRIISTFKTTIKTLKSGKNIIIYPEHDKKYNNILYEFQESFVDVARLYYNKTKQEISFVPMYIAPKLRQVHIGKPIKYCAENEEGYERKRICGELMRGITEIAESLPLHTVVPYRNIPKKYYPKNRERMEK